MISIFSKTVYTVGALFFFILCSVVLLPQDNAVAGYSPEINSTEDGGGSWGAILELSMKVKGPYAHFIVRKKDGLPFNTASEVALLTKTWRGKTISSVRVRPGSRSVELRVRLNRSIKHEPIYACLSNSFGYAWVGPVRILTKRYYNEPDPVEYEYDDGPEELYSTSKQSVQYSQYAQGHGLGRPLISQHPYEAQVNQQVTIPVTAGICREDGFVRIECVASGSDWNFSNPYTSGLLRAGEQVRIPFRFHDLGWQTISCRTLDSCCSSARTSRRIEIKKVEPVLRPSRTETKINISVVTGADGSTKSKVKVKSSRQESCAPFCDDSEITFDKPYLPEYRPAPEVIYPGTPEQDQYYDDYPLP